MSTPWKNGIYTSDKNRSSIQRVDGQKVDMFTTAYLDFPDFPPTADGTWTFGDFGPAHEEVQKATGGIKNNNVEMNLFHGKVKMYFMLKKKCVGVQISKLGTYLNVSEVHVCQW